LHHRARVKRVIQVFLNGGSSQVDTFDYKPLLEKQHDQAFNPGARHPRGSGHVGAGQGDERARSRFKQHGQCGRWVSSVFPHQAGCVDDMAFLMSVASKTNVARGRPAT